MAGLTSGVSMVTTGDGHSCALTTSGGVKCWGRNNYGQLGNGSTTNSPTPVDVTGLTSGVASISAGASHTCAVTTAGGLKCWGRNLNGQLGNASIANSSTPVDVAGLASGVATVSAGGTYTCAVTTAGGAKCWGDNHFGQLGNASNSDALAPVDVFGMSTGVGSACPSDAEPLDHAGEAEACRRPGPPAARSPSGPEQGHGLGHVADIVAAHVEQDGVDALFGDRADRGGLHRRQVQPPGQRRQRIAAIGIGRALQIIADQLQLGIARARVDERVEQLGEIAHGRAFLSR